MGITQQSAAARLVQPGVCTSSTRPASPFEGQAIYETDTDLSLVWNGSAWRAYAHPSITASDGYLRYQNAWTLATYNSGWGSYDSAPWGNAAYYRTVDGMVHLRALVKRTSGSLNTIFTLPVGYRPPHSHLFAVAGDGGVGRIDVGTSGEVAFGGSIVGTVNVASWISIFEVKFSVL
jgi:hypothetical protein